MDPDSPPDPVANEASFASEAETRLSKRDEQTVAKANEAIAIRPKRGRLTLLSRRLYNALLYHSQRQGVDTPVYALPLAELIGDARFNSNNTELLKSHLREMQATTIEWSSSGAGQRRWVSTQLIGTVSIEELGRGRACVVRWSYPNEIRERLVRPQQYTRLLLEMSAQMRSYAAAVLYEIGARYLTSPGRLTMREDTIWWAAVLTGRSDIESVDYRFLKRDVIVRALAELDTLCEDFRLELIEHKRGRKVEEMQFRVHPKAQATLDGLHDPSRNVFDLELVGRLMALGMKQEDAQELYARTDEGQLRAGLDHVAQRLKSTTMPALKSPVAYLRDALKKGYAKASEGEGRAPGAPQLPRPPSRAEQLERIREAWSADRLGNARALYAEMLEAQQTQARTRFEAEQLEQLAPPIARAWRRDGTSSRIAANSFYRWLAEITWPEQPTEQVLFDFALAKGIVRVG